ncbi:hypothetical protein FJV41_10505 [Myxococcus llanfairpwllgwyngyllgogerychwyrndrobwllllantysiliogogogochensis]|uniref:Uncharacterized protein n=1 Tax=Myxococcus llanfairpwllgwyngyllgogerychwyrndrobwllllantysiliogogogochensis TaxID=2590453 RepID=A0A540X5J0_9BACT|nr:hypothetical protein [Myxococcus llanfairpwllgwyngyllgogerychwyrndrobwllllantysiliogogogochensis]TQF15994.1 hypothetical protein FJV41_10505 [Myxococcus llanfairpwllgwyngyllgogerychwyrndrobwllllantysiliogogogochensis]
MADSHTLPDFSLVRGGLFFELERGLRIIRPPGFSAVRAALVITLVSWAPLVLLSLLEGLGSTRLLFSELQVHAELLLSLPVFAAVDPYIDGRVGVAARQFLRANLVEEKDRASYDAMARSLTHWRDAPAVELVLLGIVIALALVSTPDPAREWFFVSDPAPRPSLAGGWYQCVSQPLVRFLAFRWAWRAVVWGVFLLRVSRLRLRLVPTHPDLSGGLGFLAICQASFAPVVFAVAVAVAAYSYRTNAAAITEAPLDYVMPQVLFAVLAIICVFAPLGFFSHQLVRAKRQGDPWFSAVAAHHSREFEDRWFRRKPDEDPLGAPDFSSLADLGSSFMVARRMKLLPWDQRSLLAVATAAVAPLAILLVLDRQFLTVVNQLRQSVT